MSLGVAIALGVCSVHSLAATPFDELLGRLTPSGPINDFAGILSPADRQALLNVATSLEKDTTAQLAVVTIRSLEGSNIDDFANKLFAKWGIGQADKNNGVLFLVAMDDRAARIEVGYGLEGVLPDARAGRLIEKTLFPAFRESRHGPGLIETAKQIAAIVRGDKAAIAAAERAPSTKASELIVMTLFLSIFSAVGAFFVGASLGSRQWYLLIWGIPFGGFPLLCDTLAMRGTTLNSSIPLFVHIPIAILMGTLGYRVGKRHPNTFKGTGRRSGGRGWSSSGGGWSSGDSSGGFGGGRSGGGGASGRW